MPNNSPEGIRLYDRIMAHGIEVGLVPQARKAPVIDLVMGNLRHSMVFNIQNVADYYFLQGDKSIMDWKVEDFPNLAPPYESYFMEYRNNKPYTDKFGDIVSPHSVGVLVSAIDHAVDYKDTRLDKIAPEKTNPDQRWTAMTVLLLQMEKREPAIPVVFTVARLDNMGKPISDEHSPGIEARLFRSVLDGDLPSAAEQARVTAFALRYIFPAFLATTFLHCKGVTVSEQTPDSGLSKRHEKRHKEPLTKFHTLQIRPMQEVLRREGNVESEGLKKALHIVRGHFADYSEGRGLFGRHHGLFWMPQHLRGSPDEGRIDKDYRVHTP